MESNERGGSARTRTERAVELRVEDVRGCQGESNGRHSPDADRPQPSRRWRGGYGEASRKEKRRSEGGSYSAVNSEGAAAQRQGDQGNSNAAWVRRAAQDRRWW
jgi:hypothetical protein